MDSEEDTGGVFMGTLSYDLVVVGGPGFRARDIFALGEELRQLTRKDADVFELRELNTGTPFYNTVMQEGVRIA